MRYRPNILGSIPNRSFIGLLDTQFWQVGSCIHTILSRGESKGPCLGDVSHHLKNK